MSILPIRRAAGRLLDLVLPPRCMACGKPVISTDLGTGSGWVNQNGETVAVADHIMRWAKKLSTANS